MGNTQTIFDTGITMIVGDPVGISKLYAPIVGALPAPEYGVGLYTSTSSSSSVAHRRPGVLISVSQYLVIAILPLSLLSEARKSRFLLLHLTSDLSLWALIPALVEQPRVRSSRVVSWPDTFPGES